MGIKKRIAAAVCVAAAFGGLVYVALTSRVFPGVIPENVLTAKPTITLWYTDEALGDFLAAMSLEYLEAYDVRVLPVLTSGVEYLEEINRASVENVNAPDLYVVTNDSLEKAYLAGLAAEIGDAGDAAKNGAAGQVVTEENFPQTALNAVTYQGKKVGYPFFFETSALVYNRTYLKQAAQEMGVNEEALIPKTIDDILSFADAYNTPETVEAIFKWDVSDVFYNYFFAGNYINEGGPCGDDGSQIDIYNLEAVRGLKAYQDLNQFFSIDAEESSYNAVVQDFLEGKLVFTVATSDILNRIAAASAEGTFPYEYQVVKLPDVNEEIQTRGLSVTNVLAVNGYSEKKELANAFAAYLVDQGADRMYARTGHIPARLNVPSEVVGMDGFVAEYAESISMPKLMSTANFWVQMEIAYTKIWSGENVSDVLKALSEQIMTQVTGQPYTEEEYIEVPTETADGEFADEGTEQE